MYNLQLSRREAEALLTLLAIGSTTVVSVDGQIDERTGARKIEALIDKFRTQQIGADTMTRKLMDLALLMHPEMAEKWERYKRQRGYK